MIGEKPYLYYDKEVGYGVFVPEVKEESTGIDWSMEGTTIKIQDFYVAKPEVDTAKTINDALERDKNLLLTPGIYHLEEAIRVKRDNTVVLGMGFATLVPTTGNACMEIEAKKGVRVAGILFDAGEVESKVLLKVV